MQIEVVLLKNVRGLGQIGDILKVKKGYAVNYLIPKNLARIATKEDKVRYATLKAKKQEELELRMRMLQNIKQFIQKKLVKNPIKIEVKTSSGGKVYGSISSDKIKQALLAKIPQLRTLNPREIKIDMPDKIEYVGKYAFDVKINAKFGDKEVKEVVPIFVDIVSISKAHLKAA